MSDGLSRLDKTIARDRLMKHLEPLWDLLWSTVELTCAKMLEEYRFETTATLNDQNSAIRVVWSDYVTSEASHIKSTLELRIDRSTRRVIARITRQYSRTKVETSDTPTVYQIDADVENTSLRLTSGSKLFSAVDLVEHEVCETLLKFPLDK